MQNEPHDLVHEFPEYRDLIHNLKMSDHHFGKLFDEYHEVNRTIHRAEQDIEPVSDAHAEDLKHKRLKLKDELFHILKQNAG